MYILIHIDYIGLVVVYCHHSDHMKLHVVYDSRAHDENIHSYRLHGQLTGGQWHISCNAQKNRHLSIQNIISFP